MKLTFYWKKDSKIVFMLEGVSAMKRSKNRRVLGLGQVILNEMVRVGFLEKGDI